MSLFRLFKRHQILPFTKAQERKIGGSGFVHNGTTYIHHSRLDHTETAFRRLSKAQAYVITILLALLSALFILNWHIALISTVAFFTLLYFLDLLFNLYLIYRSFSKPFQIKISQKEISLSRTWPRYTILCPLYKEWRVLPQFIQAIKNISYPKDKLQVMLLLEEDDVETRKKIKTVALPSYVQTVIVPHSNPKTKPKACNYGLRLATGEYVVIYDAEDIPDPHQLKKAVIAFEKSDPHIICMQAKLNFYNPHQNLIAKMFTAEYSLWFELVLTGLQSIQAPIPLGGTSNHFKKNDLVQTLGGWDSFNVTEDCDLGIRLVKKGYKTAIIDSLTLEEANSNLKNWLAQRSRWIKGYIQTYLVHMRRPTEFVKDLKNPDIITFQLVVGGKILSMFINPLMWTITLTYFLFRSQTGAFIESFFPTPVLYMGAISLVLGNFLYLYYYMVGCVKYEHYKLVKYTIFVPFYWLFMSIAAWIALLSLVRKPHYWSKTKHGLHLQNTRRSRLVKNIRSTSDNGFSIVNLMA